MTEYVLGKYRSLASSIDGFPLKTHINPRIILLVIICLLLFGDASYSQILIKNLSDAYIQVTSFVAFTLFLIYSVEKIFKFDIGQFNATHPRLQLITSSFLGATPGCGGAIMVLTQFTKKQVSFGSVIATLTATMGDAAFLLISKQPETALVLITSSFFIGCITGLIVDKIHGRNFLQHFETNKSIENKEDPEANPFKKTINILWLAWLIPGTILGFLNAFQINLSIYTSEVTSVNPNHLVGVIGSLLTILIFIYQKKTDTSFFSNLSSSHERNINSKVINDTVFISIWVIAAYLLYEIAINILGIDLKELFKHSLIFLPLFGVLVGFIPGCGPQIIVTTLYLNGIVPLSAQIGNAISNDGDALFPAIAVAPKAALLATIYSAIPALIFAYSYFFLFE